jgi:glycosyltransferase involved in cell wall biosynthesis
VGRTLTTLHGRQDLSDHIQFYRRFSEMPRVSISNAQRMPIAWANFVATIHHGLPLDLHKPTLHPSESYLAFLGRISPEKRPDRAIAIDRGLPGRSAVQRALRPPCRELRFLESIQRLPPFKR